MEMRTIAEAWTEFCSSRPALDADYRDWFLRRKPCVPSATLPGTARNWPECYLMTVGLSAEDKAAWLAYQPNSWLCTSAFVPAEAIKIRETESI